MRTDERFLDVPGGRVFVRSWTPDTDRHGAPVVLLHDSLGCVDLWRDFPEALAQALARPVVAYDRLGFGRSSARQGLPSTAFIAEEAQLHFPALAAALGIGEFSLFGHSVGGGMATHCANLHREHCLALITESAQAFVEDRTLAGIREAKQGFQQDDQLDRLRKYHGDKARWVLEAWTETWLSPAFADWNLEAEVGRLDCPVLAIHGDQDEFGSELHPQQIARLTDGPSRMLLIEDCGHVPHREKPETVLLAVAELLR